MAGGLKKKVCMMGDAKAGKTSLIRRLINNTFSDEYWITAGTKISLKEIELESGPLTLMIWDIAGQSYNLHPTYYSGAKGALLVCDVTRKTTADSLISWYMALVDRVGKIPVKVLSNKTDLEEVEFDVDYVEKMGYDTMSSSAKTGENVEQAFQELAEMMMYG